MSSHRKAIAKSLPDTPWFVRARIPRDAYVERITPFSRVVNVDKSFKKIMTAKAARSKDIEIDPAYKDEEKVEVEWTESVPTTITWSEKRLHLRGHTGRVREGGNPQTIRQELYEAIKAPLTYVPYDRLLQLIDDETEQWRYSNMLGQKVHPLVLAFMSLDADGGATTRDVFYIKSCDSTSMVVTNSSDQSFEIEFEKGVLEQGVTRRFIIFLPSNIHLIDVGTEEVLL